MVKGFKTVLRGGFTKREALQFSRGTRKSAISGGFPKARTFIKKTRKKGRKRYNFLIKFE